MRQKYIISGVLCLFLIVSGCATTGNSQMETRSPSIDMQKVNLEIAQANIYMENGDPEKAQGSYQLIIDAYPDLAVRYRCGLLTNAALTSLQMGDSRRFIEYALQLETVATNVRPLPRNTQIVLAMMQVTGNRTKAPELWVSQPVERAVRSVLTAK